jgi:hypothetical protein
MVNLKQYTKEQRFALVATALVDTWEKLRRELNGPANAEFDKGTMILNIDNQGCFVNVLRQNYLTWYTFSFTFNKDKKLAFAVTPYVRNNPQFNEVTRGIFTVYSDFEKLASDLPSDYLAPFVNNLLLIFSEDNTWSQTFNHFLSASAQVVPTAKQLVKRKRANKVNTRKELRTTFLRISDFYKTLLRHSMLNVNSYTVETLKGSLDITANGLCYQVSVESGQFYTFNMYKTVGERDKYSYSLTNDKGSLGRFTDYGMFYEDADRLSGLLPGEDMLDFVKEFESLITKVGLWSAYTSLGYVK